MDQNFFVCFAILIALILYWLNQTLKEKQTQLHQSQLTASRLQLELVKKHLQPHFIMNTLTAIEEWIEESPAIAIQFIQTLADEFRCLASIADKPLVPAGQELELCQTYLTLMRYRANTHYDFVTDQVNPSLQLPPGIILTLLENAISHNQYPPGQYQFSLLQSATRKHTELCFVAPVTHSGKKRSGSGTGNKYIRARLNESFSDNWQMKVTLDSEHWFVTISLPATLHKT
nr:histidine kinase [Neptunicella marina]